MEDGEDIRTTIDIELQQKIYEEYGDDNGFSVAMNPKTGEVLAMVSTPSFDSNKFITGFTDEEWQALSTDENTPMFARYESTWVPGSSFKPITGAVGLTTISMSTSQFGSNNEFSSEINLADSGYGQGKILVNPLHVASIYSAFVNEGNMVKPYIEYKSTSDEPEYWLEDAFSKEAAEEIRDDLVQVVENANGTGHEARINGVTLAGKTGTAELKGAGEDEGEELGWFNTFVVSDEDDEQLLMINMIENVENRGGSHYLLPIVRNIIQDYLR